MVTQLAIVKIDGRHYYRDDRLQEYREVSNPNSRISFDDLGDREVEEVSEKKELTQKQTKSRRKGRFF